MRPHERLDVWQQAVLLTERVYLITGDFPRAETYGLTSQMRRAAVSVACNIAEGAASQTKAEFRRFLFIARASLERT